MRNQKQHFLRSKAQIIFPAQGIFGVQTQSLQYKDFFRSNSKSPAPEDTPIKERICLLRPNISAHVTQFGDKMRLQGANRHSFTVGHPDQLSSLNGIISFDFLTKKVFASNTSQSHFFTKLLSRDAYPIDLFLNSKICNKHILFCTNSKSQQQWEAQHRDFFAQTESLPVQRKNKFPVQRNYRKN